MGQAISQALIEHGVHGVGFEVNRRRVILRGSVRDQATAGRIKRLVDEAAPDAVIDSRLRIGERS
jgi:hypothetical protein